MRFFYTLLLAFCCSSLMAIDASISYASFKTDSLSYVEIYTHIFGGSVTFQPQEDSTLQAKVEVIILFKQEENIIKYDKFNLISPFTKGPIDFIDLKRFGLPEGKYNLIVAITDLNNKENAKKLYKAHCTFPY